MDKGSGSGIFPDPDPGDPKRPDPTGSGSATLVFTPSLSEFSLLFTLQGDGVRVILAVARALKVPF